VHELELLGFGGTGHDRAQHAASQTQDAHLGVERGRVGGEHVVERRLARQQPPDRLQVDVELAQRAHQLQPGQGGRVEQPVVGLAAGRLGHDAGVRVEADRPHGQPRAAGELADAHERRVVGHGRHAAVSTDWRVKARTVGRRTRCYSRSESSFNPVP